MVAAPFDEQIGALPGVVDRFPPQGVLWAGPAKASRAARTFGARLSEAQIPVSLAEAGQGLDLGAGAYLRVLTVGKRGAVLQLVWDRFRAEARTQR